MTSGKYAFQGSARAEQLRSAFLAMGADEGVGTFVSDLLHLALEDDLLAECFGAEDLDLIQYELGMCFTSVLGGSNHCTIHELPSYLLGEDSPRQAQSRLREVLEESLARRGLDEEVHRDVIAIFLPLAMLLLRIGDDPREL